MLKTSEFSRVRSTSENFDVFNSRDDIYLVFTEKSKFSLYFILYLKKIYEKSFSHASTGLDPEGSFTGGGGGGGHFKPKT